MDGFFATVVNALEVDAIAERPIHGQGVNAKDRLEFIEELKRRPRWSVELVHESEDWNSSLTADFKKFARLGFDALTRIDHHHGSIDGGENAVGVFRKIFVARSVEEVHHASVVVELQDCRGDRNATLLFEFHPVACRSALVLAGGDATSELDCATVEEKLFGERRFSSIRMRDDRKCAATGDLLKGGTHISKGFGIWVRSFTPPLRMSATSSCLTPPRPGM